MTLLRRYIKTQFYMPFLNAFSGMLLSIFNPFKNGDFIEIDGELGSVQTRGIRKTLIKTPSGKSTLIDNKNFYLKQVNNLSSKNIIPLDIKVSVDLNSNTQLLKESILTFLERQKKILTSPSPKVQVSKIVDQKVHLLVKPWCIIDDYLELDSTLEKALYTHLKNNSVQHAFTELVIGKEKKLAS